MGMAILANGSIRQTEANMLRRMPPIVTVRSDIRAWTPDYNWEDWDESIPSAVFDPQLTLDKIHSIGNLQNVSDYEYIIRTYLYSFYLDNIDDGLIHFPQPDAPNTFSLIGVSRSDFSQVDQGFIEIVTGRNFSAEDLGLLTNVPSAIVSEEFAYINNLSIGSLFELTSFVHYPFDETEIDEYSFDNWSFGEEFIFERITINFEIIGLFDIPVDEAYLETTGIGSAYQRRLSNLSNIYVTASSLEEHFARVNNSALEASSSLGADFSQSTFEPFSPYPIPIFILESPLYLQAFYYLAESYLPDYHQFVDLSRSFENISSSLVTIDNIANWIMIASLVATLLVFSLTVVLILRNQQHLIGILLALGEHKIRIFFQIFMEILIISFLGVTVALLSGYLISETVFTNIMKNELLSLDAESEVQFQIGEHNILDSVGIPTIRMSPEQLMETFDSSLSLETIILFYCFTFGIVLFTTIIILSFVLKRDVKKILLYENK